MTAPGSVPQSNDDLAKRVAMLERRLEELTRKNIDNATVGQGGRIRGLYKNGNEAFSFGTDPVDNESRMVIKYTTGETAIRVTPGSALYGGAEQLVINDLAKHRIMATDDGAGYGIVEPSMCVPMVSILGLNMVNGVEQEVARASGFFYSAAWASDLLVTNFNTMTAVSCRLRLSDGVTNIYSSSSGPSGGGSTHVRRIAIPSDFINKQGVTLSWMATSTGSGTFAAVGMRSHGISRNLYDLSPGLQ